MHTVLSSVFDGGFISSVVLRGLSIMFGFLKRKKHSFSDKLKAIVDIDQSLRFCLYMELLWQYETEMDRETASVLAVQVNNHLMGDDFAKVYKSLTPEVQKKVDAIGELIETKVAVAMTENKAIRELIIRHIMTTHLIYHCLFDKTWFDRLEMKNREKLIREYGSDGDEFSDVENFDKYMACVLNFIHTRQQMNKQKKLRRHNMITDFTINGVLFSMKEKLDRYKLSSANCKKAGLMARMASRARRSEILYWSKNCRVSCFGKPVVWAKLDNKFSKFMCGTSAFLFYDTAGLTRLTFQVFGDEVMAMGDFYSFVDICKQNIGEPQSETDFVIVWESEGSILRCRRGTRGKEAWFNLIAKES